MDKKLRELKNEYIDTHPVKFTEEDRERIYKRIKRSDNKRNTFSRLHIGLTLAAVILIGFTILFSQLNNDTSKEAAVDTVQPPNIVGYVTNIREDGAFFIVSESLNDENIYDAIWYMNTSIELELGNKVKGWHSDVNESFPPQAVPDKIEIVPEKRIEEATLTKEEALKKALESDELIQFEEDYIAIQDIQFNQNELVWEVVVSNLNNTSLKTIYVQESNQTPVDKAYFEQLLNKYEESFRYLVENNVDQKLTTYNTVDEIRDDFLKVMSLNQANQLIDDYIMEMDDGIYLVATIMPIFIDTNEPYELKKINDETYKIVQEHFSELRGHVTFIFTLKMINNNQWIVDSVDWE